MYAMKTNLEMKTVSARTEQLPIATLPPDAPADNFIAIPAGPPKFASPEETINLASGEITLRAGGFIDVNTGNYLPPPKDSTFDPVSNVFIPPASSGRFDPSTGNFIPPEGFTLDDSGQLHPAPEGKHPKRNFNKLFYADTPQNQQEWDRTLELMRRRENRDLYNAPPPTMQPRRTKTNFHIIIQ